MRAELTEIKEVLGGGDDDFDRDDPEARRRRKEEELRLAKEELERAEAAMNRAREEYDKAGGSDPWKKGSDAKAGGVSGAGDWSQASKPNDGANPWAKPASGGGDGAAGWGQPSAPATTSAPAMGGQAMLYPRWIREAYAALELPLGADRGDINRSHDALVARYAPDKHQDDPKRQAAAAELTRRIGEARDKLVGWMGERGL